MKKKNALTAVSIALITIFLIGCDKEPSTIGSEVIGEGNYETKKATFDVIAYNRNLNSVRTDGLGHYQLGTYVHPVFGTTKASVVSQLSLSSANPRFGLLSAAQELERYQENQATPDTHLIDDEAETVTAVYLHIPFFSSQIEDDEDDDDEDDETPENCRIHDFKLDSIFGNREENFNITVSKVTDFIQSLDPDSNFETTKAYFSDDTFNVDPNPWFQGTHQIQTTSYVIKRNTGLEDNDNTDENEAITCETIPPGIRILLDETAVFQEFLDAEGSDELASNANFSDYLRGLMIEADATDLTMFLNINEAFLSVEYNFQRIDNKNTTEDTSDDEVVTGESHFKINLSG